MARVIENAPITFMYKPWPHMIVDDLIDHEWITQLVAFSNTCQLHGKFGLHHFGSDMVDHDISFGHEDYHTRLIELLPEMDDFFITRRQASAVDFVSHLAVQPAGYAYPTHCDHPDKIYSIVSYLAPACSHGTLLHTGQDEPACMTIEWKIGRTLIFAGLDNVTWHSYHSGTSSRTTLCGFFVCAGTNPTR